MTQNASSRIETLVHLINTVHRLRAPGGCPWDRAQTHQSLRPYLIEEAYEVLDVIDQIHQKSDLQVEKNKANFREELGDLLMQVLLHSEMAHEEGAFDIYDVAQGLDEKLIRRHPHVFGESQADTADVALQSWEKEKAKEKAAKLDASILDGVPRGLPGLQKVARVIEKVTKVGFQWNDLEGPLGKVEEEWSELKEEIRRLETENTDAIRKRVEAEMGDLLFSLCNVSYLMKINPEDALRSTLSRFQNRFKHVERSLKELGKTPDQSNLEEMDQYWDQAKKLEKLEVWGLTGGIAAGKSTVAQIFAELGIPVIDADQISRDVMENHSEVRSAVQNKFGTTDRAKLRELVFQDSQLKKELENILHPAIQKESRKQILSLANQGKHSVVLYEAALLVETGRFQEFKGLIVVDAPREVRLSRLLTRVGIEKETAEKILNSQIDDEERKKHATHLISNSGDLASLKKQIQEWVSQKGWN
jgi:dephospho-CoA kinase